MLLTAGIIYSQDSPTDYSAIDRKVLGIESSDPVELSHLLTDSLPTEKEKVRAIFRWITEHISYYRYVPKKGKRKNLDVYPDNDINAPDTSALQSVTERVARKIFRDRKGFCDGYSRLFKYLCDNAGIKSQIVTGYARSDLYRLESRFRSNHSWNAVCIDSAWYLLDVTWASGFITTGDQFVKRYEDYFFLTPPDKFIRHHYPDDMRWTLLTSAPPMTEFRYTPFRVRSFVKYPITDYFPSRGIIEARVGDTVHLELDTEIPYDAISISPDSLWEAEALPTAPNYAYLAPTFLPGKNKVLYSYHVESDAVEWLHIMYNNDAVLRYRLIIKKDKK
jgi:hypothetical protein